MPGRLALLAALVTLAAGLANAADPYDTDSQTTHRRLVWEDFKAPPRPMGRWQDGASAYIVAVLHLTGHEPEVTGEGEAWAAHSTEIEAYAVMEKRLSGVSSGAKNSRVLGHEQRHFDLAEAFARELTPRLRELRGEGVTERGARLDWRLGAREARDAAARELEEVQRQYDRETAHGARRGAQRKWEKRIQARLDAASEALTSAGAVATTEAAP